MLLRYSQITYKTIIGDDGLDLIFCNGDEARSFTGTHTIEAAAEGLKKYAKTFVITRGPGGSLVFDGNNLIHTDGVLASAVDTNGAGDMFAGAFLHALLRVKVLHGQLILLMRPPQE